jgi:hypothetical protein
MPKMIVLTVVGLWMVMILGTAGAPMPVADRAGQGFSGRTTAGRDGLRRALTRPLFVDRLADRAASAVPWKAL